MMAPAVILLLGWMLVPLSMTLWFSFRKYLPLRGGDLGFVGWENYSRFVSSSSFWPSITATLIIVGGVLVITVCLGILLALLLDQPMWGQGIVRILVIAPFFVMPTVSALVWKNMFMDPTNGLLAHLWRFFGAQPVEWLSQASLQSIIMIVSWQWLPFAAIQVLANDAHQEERKDVGEDDGIDTACGAKADILTFQHPLEDQVSQRLGAKGATRGHENLGKDRQKENRLDQDHDRDGAGQMRQDDVPEPAQGRRAIHLGGLKLLAVEGLHGCQKDERCKGQPLPADDHDDRLQ